MLQSGWISERFMSERCQTKIYIIEFISAETISKIIQDCKNQNVTVSSKNQLEKDK
jgi:hypothetical protein